MLRDSRLAQEAARQKVARPAVIRHNDAFTRADYRIGVRFRRGWAIVVALGVTETTSYGILYYAFAVLLGPMERELGWSRAQLTGAFSLALLVSGVAAVPVGWWVDRHGARLLMTVGSCLA